jgi:hypothetical protein
MSSMPIMPTIDFISVSRTNNLPLQMFMDRGVPRFSAGVYIGGVTT